MRSYTSPRPTYSPSELNVALHDRDALCVDRTKVPEQIPLDSVGFDAVFVGRGEGTRNLRVFEQMNEVGFRRFLESEDGRTLPS